SLCDWSSDVCASDLPESERGARAERAGDPDLAAVQLDEFPAEGEPEPGALLLRRARPHLPALREDGLVVLRRDAHPGVDDRHVDGSVLGGGPHFDPAAFRSE